MADQRRPAAAAADTRLAGRLKLVLGGLALAALTTALVLCLWPHRLALLTAWCIIEVACYVIVTAPRAQKLDASQPDEPPPSVVADAPRQWARFLQHCKTSQVDKHAYCSGWFRGAPFESIKRDNVKEFIAYGFHYSTQQQMEARGLGDVPEQMVRELEAVWGTQFEPGYNPDIAFMAHLWEPLNASFRPLAFYLAAEAVGACSRHMLRRWGFVRHKHSGLTFFSLHLHTPPAQSLRVDGAGGSSSNDSSGGVQQQPGQQQAAGLPAARGGPFAAFGTRNGSGQVRQQQQQQVWGDWLKLAMRSGASRSSVSDGSAGSVSVGSRGHAGPRRPFAFPRTAARKAAAAATAQQQPQQKLLQPMASDATSAAAPPPPSPPSVPEAEPQVEAPGMEDEVFSSPFFCPTEELEQELRRGSVSSITYPPQQQQPPRSSPAAEGGAASALPPAAAAALGSTRPPSVLRSRPSVLQLCPQLTKQTSLLLDSKRNPLQAALSVAGVMGADTPLVFLHGIGGLPFYLELLLYLMALGNPVLVVEMKHVAMRLGHVKSVPEVAEGVLEAMDRLAIPKACIVAHSYGTFVATYMARTFPQRVQACMLVDPVACGMWLPNLIHSFLYARPHLASWSRADLLTYVKAAVRGVVSTEMHVRAAVSRRFFWSELNAWPEDLPPGSVLLLSGKDDLMSSPEVRDMFASARHVKVMYEPDLAHASFLLNAEVKQALKEEVKAVLARSGNAVAGLAMQLSRYVKPQHPPRSPPGAPANGRAASLWRSWSVGAAGSSSGSRAVLGSLGSLGGGGSSSRSGSRAGANGLQQQQQGPDGEDGPIARRWSSVDARHQHGSSGTLAAVARLRKQVQQEEAAGAAAGVGRSADGGGEGLAGGQAEGTLKKAE